MCAVKMDPATIPMTMGMVTRRLRRGVTYSTTYYGRLCRPPLRDDGSDAEGRRCLAHCDVAQTRGGAQFRPRSPRGIQC